jgi:mannose-6-phosphate isomerase
VAKKKVEKSVALKNVVEKPWGHELIITQNDLYVVKQLFIKAKQRLSLQLHRKKHEHITLIQGQAAMFLETDVGQSFFVMSHMQPIEIDPGVVHRVTAGDEDAILVEVSTPELDDVVRLKDDYGREDNLDANEESDGDFGADNDMDLHNEENND